MLKRKIIPNYYFHLGCNLLNIRGYLTFLNLEYNEGKYRLLMIFMLLHIKI